MSKLSFQEELDRLIKISEEELLSDTNEEEDPDESNEDSEDDTEDAEDSDASTKSASFNKLAALAKQLKRLSKLEDSVSYSDLHSYVRSLGNGRN